MHTVFRQIAAASAAETRHERRRIAAVARSPIFDKAFYEAQARTTFPKRRAAVAHFLATGMAAGLSISPFFQNEWYCHFSGTPKIDAFDRFFFGTEETLDTTAPIFDARVYASQRLASGRPAPATSRGALEHFLRNATESSILPVHSSSAGAPTMGEARDRALQTAAHNTLREHVLRSRLSPTADMDPVGADDLGPVEAATDLVTIVLPVRNRAHVVATAIRSVLAQTHQAWNLIVVDDGSTDATAAVVREFASQEPRIRLINQPQRGVCAARNAGLYEATGAYVAFIDSDNAWTPRILQRSVRALNETGAVAVYSAVKLIDEHGGSQYLAFVGDHADLLDGGNFVDLNTLVSRRDALLQIEGFDENLRRWVDYDLAIRLFEIGHPLFLNFVGVAYSESTDTGRISTTEAPGWEQVVLSKYWLDWDAVTAGLSSRRTDLVSVVIVTYADWLMTLNAVRAVLDLSGNIPIEIVVIDNGSPDIVGEILATGLLGDPRVTLIPWMRNTNFALGSNLGFARTSGSRVVFLNNDTLVHDGWLAPLVDALAKVDGAGAVQPLIVDRDDIVENAGLVMTAPTYLPVAQTDYRTGSPRPESFSGVAVMFRAVDFAEFHGFDPLFSNGFEDADLALRMTEVKRSSFEVAPDSVVTHLRVFSPGRFAATAGNEAIFASRWRDKLSLGRPPEQPPISLGQI
jgi:glycosyltransferase involved in cell wall biosynthesis